MARSQRDKAAEGAYNQLGGFDVNSPKRRQASGLNPKATGLNGEDIFLYEEVDNPNYIKNRFDSFDTKPKFSSDQILSSFDEGVGNTIKSLREQGINQGASARGDTVRNLASRGIKGGAVFEDAMKKTTGGVNRGTAGAISDVGVKAAGMKPSIMQKENEFGFKTEFAKTSGAQNVDMQKVKLVLQKLRDMMSGSQYLEDDTWFDDLLEVGNTVGGFFPGRG